MSLQPCTTSPSEATQLEIGRVIDRDVLPFYRRPFPANVSFQDAAGRRRRVAHPFYGVHNGRALDYEAYRRRIAETGCARSIHGPIHAVRTALWCGLLATLYARHDDGFTPDLIPLQIAAAFHDAARGDEGIDRWEARSEAMYARWNVRHCQRRARSFTDLERALLRDADTLEIQRVLAPGERFETERLRFPQEMPMPDQMVAQLIGEVATLIAITESRAIKRDLEQGDHLYLRLLNLIAQLHADDSGLPFVHDLVREMVG
jgi:hypothetical protein